MFLKILQQYIEHCRTQFYSNLEHNILLIHLPTMQTDVDTIGMKIIASFIPAQVDHFRHLTCNTFLNLYKNKVYPTGTLCSKLCSLDYRIPRNCYYIYYVLHALNMCFYQDQLNAFFAIYLINRRHQVSDACSFNQPETVVPLCSYFEECRWCFKLH